MPVNICCMLAEIAAFIRTSADIWTREDGVFEIDLQLRDPGTARHVLRLLQGYYGIDSSVDIVESSPLSKGRMFLITLGEEDLSKQILREIGLLVVREGKNVLEDSMAEGLLRTKCCRKAYLRALFLASGTMSDPEKAYHFEIDCRSERIAADVKKLLNTFEDLSPRIYSRQGLSVVYIKEAGQILDLLAIMGAHGQYFAMEETRFKKELRNSANRLANCDHANIDKSLAAANRSIAYIEAVGIENLPPKLAHIAKLRVQYPEMSLKDLGEMLDPPLKKAGVNSRLKRIEALACALEKEEAGE